MKVSRAEPAVGYSTHSEKIGVLDSFFLQGERRVPGFYRSMFDQDFERIFLSTSRHSDNPFEIVSNSDELTLKLFGNVRTRYSPRTTQETILEFVEDVAQSLIRDGKAYYFVRDDEERENIYIDSFSSRGVARLFGRDVQWLPNREKTHWNGDEDGLAREIRVLDSRKTMRFVMPKPIKRVLSRQSQTLDCLDRYDFEAVNFQPRSTYESPNPVNHFEFGAWQAIRNSALHRATRSTGWNAREYDASKRSDFFVCHRLIRFRRIQLLLRDGILNQLGREFSKVGKEYDAKFSIRIAATSELPSVERLNELEALLVREEVGFAEIMDYCYQC